METLQNIFQAEIIQRLGWTLVHFVWQATAIGLILAIILKLLYKSSANLRYITTCMALALIVLMPAVTIKMVDVSVETIEPIKEGAVDLPKVGAGAQAVAGIPQVESPLAEATAPRVPLKDKFIESLQPALPYVVVGWLVGVFGLSLWHLGGWRQLQRLRRQMVKQVTPTLKGKLQQLSNMLGIQETVGLVESALVQVPTVVGHLKPVILLPASALTGLSSEQIEAILAHELAHIKRHDYLVNMLQTVVEILGFYHPAVWWVSHKIRVERENCCDDLAVSLCSDRVCYAKALTTMEEIRAGQLGLAVAASGGSLFNRIRRLLAKDNTNEGRLSWLPSAIAIILLILLLIPAGFTFSAKATETTENSEFKATLTNGVTVKLIGVCEHPSQGKQWWKPDGALLKKAPYDKIQETPFILEQLFSGMNGKFQQIELALRIITPTETPPKVSWRMESSGRIYYMEKILTDGNIAPQLKALLAAVSSRDKMIDVKLNINDNWIRFKNVALKPNLKTSVQIEVEKPAEPVEVRRVEPNNSLESKVNELPDIKNDKVRVYQVNRNVSDFPEAEDFSTPESAYAAINRVMAAEDYEGWQRVSIRSLAGRLAREQQVRKKKVDPEWSKVVLNARILEVRIKEDQAVVIAEFPQELISEPIRKPIDYRHLILEDGKWLNTGENRYDTIDRARAKFDKMLEAELRTEERYREVLDKPEVLLSLAEELFDKLRNADYERVLNYYDEQTGKWRRDGWKKLGLDYMVHTDWPSFAFWVCRTFRDNPIESVDVGEVFISDKEVLEKIKAPAVPYRLVLQDGGILDGDLYFVYWDHSGKWQAAEGIDWHLQKNPIKKPEIVVRVEELSSPAEDKQKQITVQVNVFSIKSKANTVRDFLADELKLEDISNDKPWLEAVTLTDTDVEDFSKWMNSRVDASILASPKVRTFQGEKSEMRVTNRAEYVAGYENGKPKKEEFVTGVEFTFTPELRKDKKLVVLKMDFKKRDLVELVKKTDESGNEVESPILNVKSINTTVAMKEGKSVLIPVSGLQRPETSGEMIHQTILLVRADVQVGEQG